MRKGFVSGCTALIEAFEGARHGFFNYGRFENAFEVTLQKSDEFLESLGYLPVEHENARERESE